MRLVRDEALAEELANEVFMGVWRNAARYEGRSQVGTWLLSIGRNRASSLLRKRRELAWDEDAAAEIADEEGHSGKHREDALVICTKETL